MNTHFIRTVILFVATWIYYPIYAQQSDTLFVQREKSGKIAFARFSVDENSDRKMQNDTIFLKAILQTKKEDEFRLKSVTTDEFGITHKRFQQYYRGIKVENAEYLLHGKDDNIEYINGDFQDINIQSITPIINEQQALLKALEYVRAERYKWEDPAMEKFVKQHRNNPNATYYPKGELVIAKDYLKRNNLFYLSWKFTISSLQPDNEQIIIVNAINGEIIQDVPLILSTNVSCTAQTLYSGLRYDMTCDSYQNGYRLFENRNTTSGQSVIINTKNCLNQANYAYAIDFSNTNTYWTSGNWATFSQNQVALDAHWGAEKVLDYWSSVHNRNSLNNVGLNITSYVHYNPLGGSSGWVNAQWDGSGYAMRYGDGSGNITPLTALDIIAHEMGHGITQFTANLYYSNTESGALSEGFSDIWGACVKNFAAPSKPIWLCGGEIFQNSSYNCIRDMQNPKSSLAYEGQHPNTYQGQYWDTWEEPHFNSTVLSHWFYILSVGKSGINDNNDIYNVTGIGINKAQQIAYKTLLDLYPTANYTATRNAAIQAAINLYGDCSPEVIAVINAWYAVGVGSGINIDITNNTVWTSNMSVYGNVTVMQGATLTINSTVKFATGTSITVKLGGKLYLNGATLTNACNGEMWQGIRVEGNTSLSQSPNSNQGYVSISNNTLIENAVCALQTVSTSLIILNPTSAGIITASNSTFKNNGIAVKFISGISAGDIPMNFTQCTFTVDNNYLGNSTPDVNSHIHVKMNNVDNKFFKGCTFSNTSSMNWRGIVSENAGFTVDYQCAPNGPISFPCNLCQNYTPTTFQGFNKAIDVNTTGTQRRVKVTYSLFSNNNTSIAIAGNNYTTITRSEFNLSYLQSGIALNNASGYKIEENKFHKNQPCIPAPLSPCLFVYGIQVGNSGVADNIIYRNQFTNILAGISVSGINSNNNPSSYQGLEFQCNQFTNGSNDIYMNSGSQIKNWQGTTQIGADNKFINTQNHSIYNIVQQITYYHSTGNNHAPYNVGTFIGVVNNAPVNSCTSTLCLPAQKSAAKLLSDYNGLQKDYDDNITDFNRLNYNDIMTAYLNGERLPEDLLQPVFEKLGKIITIGNQMRDIAHHAVSTILEDTVLNTDLLKEWYSVIRTPIAKYSLAETHFQTGELAKSDVVLAEIPAMFNFTETEMTEHENYLRFHHFKKSLKETNRTWAELTESEIAELQDIALATDRRSATMAKGVLCFFYNICIEENIQEDNTPPVQPRSLQSTQNRSDNDVLVYPNPANEWVEIVSNRFTDNGEAITIAKVEIYDLMGRCLLSENINATSGRVKISSLPVGIYTLKACSENSITVKKLIKR